MCLAFVALAGLEFQYGGVDTVLENHSRIFLAQSLPVGTSTALITCNIQHFNLCEAEQG